MSTVSLLCFDIFSLKWANQHIMLPSWLLSCWRALTLEVQNLLLASELMSLNFVLLNHILFLLFQSWKLSTFPNWCSDSPLCGNGSQTCTTKFCPWTSLWTQPWRTHRWGCIPPVSRGSVVNHAYVVPRIDKKSFTQSFSWPKENRKSCRCAIGHTLIFLKQTCSSLLELYSL